MPIKRNIQEVEEEQVEINDIGWAVYGDASILDPKYAFFKKTKVATEGRRAFQLAKRVTKEMAKKGFDSKKVINNLHPSLTAYKK